MDEKREIADSEDELIGTLIAISVVSKRLARNLAAQSKPKKGALRNEPRYVNDHHRTSPCRRCY